MTKRWLLVLVGLAMCPRTGRAQSTSAEAEQLFRDGRRLSDEGKYAEACSAFDESYKLDPSVNTLANRANCREKNGQLATAWGLFIDLDRATRNDTKNAALNKTGKDRATKIEGRLSYMTVSVPDESRIEGLTLTRNGDPFDEGMWNRAIPVDGGEYTISGSAPGHEQWATTVTVPEQNGRVSVDVPKFKEIEKLIEKHDRPEPDAKPESTQETHPGTRAHVGRSASIGGQRKLSLVVAGIGALAAGAGVVFGAQEKGFEDDARHACPQNPCAMYEEANAFKDRAESRALYANISVGASAALIVGAAVLWLTGAPHAVEVTPVATKESAGLEIAVRF